MHNTIEALEDRQFMAAGTLDPSFGTGGTATLQATLTDTSLQAKTRPNQLVIDAAGRTLVMSFSNSSINVVRLTPDGKLDTRFAVATDNKIVVFGSTDLDNEVPSASIAVDSTNRVYLQTSGGVTRYLSSGKLDRSFGKNGGFGIEPVTHILGPRISAKSLAIDHSGRLWILGSDDAEDHDLGFVIRVTPNGVLDTTFNSRGTPGVIEGYGSSADAIRVMRDGSIQIIYSSVPKTPFGSDTTTATATAVKFNAAGNFDLAYGHRGKVTYSVSWPKGSVSPGAARPVGILGDGSVLLYSQKSGKRAINFAITPAGRFGGQVTYAYGQVLSDADFIGQPDGRELVVDHTASTLRRYKPNLGVDKTFNGGKPIGNVDAATVGKDGAVIYAGVGASATDDVYKVSRAFGTEGPAARMVPSTLVAAARELPFRVVYRDDDAVDVSTITGQELRVIAPDGSSIRAILSGVSESNGNLIADYIYRPAGHRLTAKDNGIYAIRLLGNRVFDVNGNAAELRTIGSVVVNIQSA